MAGWELALVIVAVTFMMVNVVQVLISLRMMVKMDGLLSKSVNLYEKLLTFGEKTIDEFFKELEDDEN